MSLQALEQAIKAAHEEEYDSGFYLAYIQGLTHIRDESGDGGLSSLYFQGLVEGLKLLEPDFEFPK